VRWRLGAQRSRLCLRAGARGGRGGRLRSLRRVAVTALCDVLRSQRVPYSLLGHAMTSYPPIQGGRRLTRMLLLGFNREQGMPPQPCMEAT